MDRPRETKLCHIREGDRDFSARQFIHTAHTQQRRNPPRSRTSPLTQHPTRVAHVAEHVILAGVPRGGSILLRRGAPRARSPLMRIAAALHAIRENSSARARTRHGARARPPLRSRAKRAIYWLRLAGEQPAARHARGRDKVCRSCAAAAARGRARRADPLPAAARAHGANAA